MKKGFTLIELLAVLIILGIISIITVPKVFEQLAQSKKNVAKSSSISYIKAIDKYELDERMNRNNIKLDGLYTINSNGNLTNETETINIELNGKKPSGGMVIYKNDEFQFACVTIDNFRTIINSDQIGETEEGECGTSTNEAYFTYDTNEDETLVISGFSDEYKNNHSNEKFIILPSTHEGKTISLIKNEAFKNSDIDTIIIPGTIKTIGNGAFWHSSVKTAVINEGVEIIGSGAFAGSELSEITMADSIKEIKSSAFSNTKINKITLGSNLQIIDTAAFQGCTNLDKIIIPNGVTTIGISAFAQSGLKEVTIPNSVITISEAAFQETNLREITIPDSVENLRYDAFYKIKTLKKATVGAKNIYSSTFIGTGLEEVIITDNVETINPGSFSSIESLKTVTIGRNVTSMDYAFQIENNQVSKLETVYNRSSLDLSTSNAFNGRTGYTIINQ